MEVFIGHVQKQPTPKKKKKKALAVGLEITVIELLTLKAWSQAPGFVARKIPEGWTPVRVNIIKPTCTVKIISWTGKSRSNAFVASETKPCFSDHTSASRPQRLALTAYLVVVMQLHGVPLAVTDPAWDVGRHGGLCLTCMTRRRGEFAFPFEMKRHKLRVLKAATALQLDTDVCKHY